MVRLYYRMGTSNGCTGSTAWSAAQARIVERMNRLRAGGQYAKELTNEEYVALHAEDWKKVEEREKAERANREEIEKRLERKQLREKASEESSARVEKDKKFPDAIKKKLSIYHEPPEGDTTTEAEWKAIYEDVEPFFYKCVVAYRFGVDKAIGRTEGDLGDFWGKDLPDYFDRRGIPVYENEAGFESLFAHKLSFFQFLSASLVDKIDEIEEDKTQDKQRAVLEFVLVDEVTQIELEELVLEK